MRFTLDKTFYFVNIEFKSRDKTDHRLSDEGNLSAAFRPSSRLEVFPNHVNN